MAAGREKKGVTTWFCSFNIPTKTIKQLQSQKRSMQIKAFKNVNIIHDEAYKDSLFLWHTLLFTIKAMNHAKVFLVWERAGSHTPRCGEYFWPECGFGAVDTVHSSHTRTGLGSAALSPTLLSKCSVFLRNGVCPLNCLIIEETMRRPISTNTAQFCCSEGALLHFSVGVYF